LKDNPYQNPALPHLYESDPNKKAIGFCTEDLVYMEKIKELQDYLDKVNAKFLVINSSVFYSDIFFFIFFFSDYFLSDFVYFSVKYSLNFPLFDSTEKNLLSENMAYALKKWWLTL
jgi:hypothetical protein